MIYNEPGYAWRKRKLIFIKYMLWLGNTLKIDLLKFRKLLPYGFSYLWMYVFFIFERTWVYVCYAMHNRWSLIGNISVIHVIIFIFKKFHKNVWFSPVMQPTSDVDGLFCCKNRFGVNPGKCFSKVDCVSGLKGVRTPHGDADNIECSCK